MKIEDTRVSIGGAMRCCLSTICTEFPKDANVQIGAETRCHFCKQLFVLRDKKKHEKHPMWEIVLGDK